MNSTEEEPNQEAEGSTDVCHKMASHENVSGGCTSAENIWGRLESYKCPRPSLLRVIAITIAVVALLGFGACVGMYLTSIENKHGEPADPLVKESPNERLLESRMVSPALSKMTPAQAWLATTLPDNTTELPQMADTQPDQSTHGFYPLTMFSHCNHGYRLLAGTCIKLASSGWFGKSHDGAKKACKKEGATLAMPKTEELDVALRDLVKTEGGNKEHWIGMEEKKGTWYWVDGSKVGNNGYQPGRSSGWLYRRSGGKGYVMWDDEACYIHRKRFICQRPPA
ncbi:hypothetical protein Bbelb_116190 [Branchiostoma belcheri]|nr:hypothetical protein Bbelb_116190 [Branchiostoma belcheri]